MASARHQATQVMSGTRSGCGGHVLCLDAATPSNTNCTQSKEHRGVRSTSTESTKSPQY